MAGGRRRIGARGSGIAGAAVIALLLAGCASPSTSRGTTRPAAVTAGNPAVAASVGPLAEFLPEFFPAPVIPLDNPQTAAKAELGRHLFYDRRLSVNGTVACATCHRQELAFSDGRARAEGATGELHPRGAMSLANVAYSASFAWDDPNLESLEEQARVPMFNEHPVEMGLAGREEEVLRLLREEPVYSHAFPRAFPAQPDPFTFDNLMRAIAAFERTLISGDSPYDRRVYGDEADALSDDAERGMDLFFSHPLGCSDCHAGFTFSGPVVFAGADERKPLFHNNGLKANYPSPNQGLKRFTGRPEDEGRFRAPTLRNIALTAPYMHDGSLPDLESVIEHYARGGEGHLQQSVRVHGFTLSAADRQDLIVFLEALTDRAFVENPAYGNPWPEASR
ncbi:MAG: MbnH family di-heme enzyme [Acidobacteriota bacterium]